MLRDFFIADDFYYLLEASQGVIPFLGYSAPAQYRPVGQLFYTLGFHLFGVQSQYYYLMAFAVHAVNGYLVFVFALRIFKERTAALCCALFFVTFAAANEAVFWFAASTTEGLYTMFLLLSLLMFAKFLDTRFSRYYVASLSLFVVSLLSKESAVALVLLVLGTGWLGFLPFKSALRFALPYGLVGLGFLASISQPWLAGWGTVYSLGPHVLLNLLSYLASLASLGILTTISRTQGGYELMLGLTQGLTSAFAIIAAAVFLLSIKIIRSTNKIAKYALLWMLIALVPYSPLIFLQIRYMYLATIGAAILLAAILASRRTLSMGRGARLRKKISAIVIAAMVIAGILLNNIGSAYYANLGDSYRNILHDIKPPTGTFPAGTVLVFLGLPRTTSGQIIPHLQSAIRLYYGGSLVVVAVDSDSLQGVLSKYQGRPVFVYEFNSSTAHVTQISLPESET
jgi:hypothetical protein